MWAKLLHFLEHFGLSLVWLLFILFFTYSGQLIQMTHNDADWDKIYFGTQSRLMAVLVNLGLILMLVIDYMHTKKKNYGFLVITACASFFVIFGLYGHAKLYLSDRASEFWEPLTRVSWSYFLQTFFIVTLLIVRYKTIEKEPKMKKEFNFQEI